METRNSNELKELSDKIDALEKGSTKLIKEVSELIKKGKKRFFILESTVIAAFVAAIVTGLFNFYSNKIRDKQSIDIIGIEAIAALIQNETSAPEGFRNTLTQLCLILPDDSKVSKEACKNINALAEIKEGSTVIIGTVYEEGSSKYVPGVEITNSINNQVVKSNLNGFFRLDFKPDSDFNIVLTFKKNGYKDDSLGLTVRQNSIRTVGFPLQK